MRSAKTTATQDGSFGLLIFALIAGALLASGCSFYLHKASQVSAEQHRVIAAIGLLKSGLIQRWRKERLADARELALHLSRMRRITEFLHSPDSPEQRSALLEHLTIAKRGDDYQSCQLLGIQSDGSVRLLIDTEGIGGPIRPASLRAITQSIRGSEPVFSDFMTQADGSTMIDVSAVVRDAEGRARAVVVLRTNAEAFLFPMIQKWPLPNQSAETILAVRSGADALVPHRLRHHATTAQRWQVPLAHDEHPVVQAVLGQQGRFEGLDYRGQFVLADLRAIPESPWFIVSKIDRNEALRHFQFEALLIGSTTGASILVAWMAMGYRIRRRQALSFQALYEAERLKLAAEQSLAASEAYFRSIFQQAAVGVAKVNAATGRFVSCNQRLCDLLGYSQEELQNIEWSTITHPADRERDKGTAQRFLSSELRESSFEKRYLRKDGRVVWALLSVSAIATPGAQPEFYSTIIVDITERKHAELALQESVEKWHSLFAILPVGVSLLGADYSVVEFNPALGKILDMTPESLRIGAYRNRRYVLADGSEMPPQEAPSHRAIREQKVIQAVEVGVLKEDGQTIWTEVCASPLQLPHYACVVVTSDITERKRAEAQQRHIQAELLQAQKMESLGRLAGGVAHDMNNVLAAILSLSSTHQGSLPVDSSLSRTFELITMACVRGGNLVRGLLRFARKHLTEEHELNLNTLVHDEIQLLEHTTLARVQLVEELVEDLLPICGDPGALSHLLMNLCVNAVDAMPEGGVLTLRTRNAGNWVELEVEDNGVGMSQQVQERALEPFFTTKPHGKGTGLGLPMVYATVKAHHGELFMHSVLGQGTRVLLRFPAARPIEQRFTPPAQPDQSETHRQLMVLQVDDDVLVRECSGLLIVSLGHRFSTAETGESALQQIEAGLRPDVILLDQNMPGLGGAETLPRLRDLLPSVPIIVVTGLVEESTIDLVETYPLVTLLPKPFSREDLQQHLETLCGTRTSVAT
jgi:PAS domain S-box-containing protein